MRVLSFRALIVCLCLWSLPTAPSAQESISSASKFDEFTDLRADDALSRLKHFAAELKKDAKLRAYIIGYGERRISPGSFLSKIYGYQHQLHGWGVNLARVHVVEGGNRERAITELWLVPEGTAVPKPTSEFKVSAAAPLKFDTVYPDCPAEFSLHLEGLDERLEFYAKALRENPDARSWVVVYPGQRSGLNKALRIARDTKRLLIKNHDTSAGRIVTKAKSRRRECSEIELWIVPATATPADIFGEEQAWRLSSTSQKARNGKELSGKESTEHGRWHPRGLSIAREVSRSSEWLTDCFGVRRD